MPKSDAEHDQAKGAELTSRTTWMKILADAYAIFDDLGLKGYGPPPFSLGGGTVLMFDYKHRLSKDIDLFTHDAQWIPLVSPRLNDKALGFAKSYSEQSNAVKIETTNGDIDFIVAPDLTTHDKTVHEIGGRPFKVDPPSEILAKKLFYRAANFQPRDVYDMSAIIDLAPQVARKAVAAAASKADILALRLRELRQIDEADLLRGIVPYDKLLRHSGQMIDKVDTFITKTLDDPENSKSSSVELNGRDGSDKGRTP